MMDTLWLLLSLALLLIGNDGVELESLVGKTTEENGIAWIKAFTCIHSQSFVYDTPFNDENGFIEYAKYATSIKFITPNGNIEVYAQECNSQVLSMNNGNELSFTIDANTHKITGFSDTNAWVGSTSYVGNSCYSNTGGVGALPRALDASIFHACQNGQGFHMFPNSNHCGVGGETIIDAYLGFDDQLSVDCQNNPIPFASVCNIGTFNWDDMVKTHLKAPEIEDFIFNVDNSDLTLTIRVELPYLGLTSANNQREAKFGTTYVLDFEDFNAHSDAINEPGSCENRMADSFIDKTFNQFWSYSEEPQNTNGIGSLDTLAYPPSDKWTMSMKDNGCDTIIYDRTFTWQELRECSGFDGTEFTTVEHVDNKYKLSGTFYINVVSPFWYNSDLGYYRVYQLLSKPFIISVSSTVHVLGSTGINLITMWVVAVYKQDQERKFRLVLMTETAEYLTLTRGTENNEIFHFEKATSNTNNIEDSIFNVHNTAETGSSCLNSRNYICTQLWNIDAELIDGCTIGENGIGTDFSGTYSLEFTPTCKDENDQHCHEFLTDHGIETGYTMDTDLTWTDNICDPQIFELQFLAHMLFYIDDQFTDNSDIATLYNIDGTDRNSYLYQAGVDRIYVEIDTNFPDNTFTIFNTVLTNVWICTFPPGITPKTFEDIITENGNNQFTQMGCENGAIVDNFDQILDTSTWDGWNKKATSTIEAAMFQIIDNDQVCYVTNPCIHMIGYGDHLILEDVYIERAIDVSSWDTVTIHTDIKTGGLEEGEYGFVELFCDTQAPQRTDFRDINYYGCFPVDTAACTTLTLRIGGKLSAGGDHIYVTRVALDVAAPSQFNEMGCFNSAKDSSLSNIVNDIYPITDTDIVEFIAYTESETNVIRFSFIIPNEVTRDTLYIHAQIEVELQEPITQTRRRMLLDVNTANQISHFGDEVGVTNKNNHKKPNEPINEPINEPQLPINNIPNPSTTIYLSLKSPVVIIIGSLLALILTFNICFMCYVNCYKNKKRGKGYEKVKHIDSEFDSEAQMLDNQ